MEIVLEAMGRAAARSQGAAAGSRAEQRIAAAYLNALDDEDRRSIRDAVIRELEQRRSG